MAVRHNIDAIHVDGSRMTVLGTSDPESGAPVRVHVFIEQNGHVAEGPFDKPATGWTVSMTVTPGHFTVGKLALAYAVEMRQEPVVLTTTWSQLIEIKAKA